MNRKGVPNACDKKCSPWCAIKEKLDALWDRTHNAFTSLNGVEGDGTGNLQIEAGENISLEQSGNRIRITGEGGVEYTARSPLDIYEHEIFARMGPVQEGWTWLVSADNIDKQIKAQIQAEVSARDTQIGTQVSSEATARTAADDDLQDQIDDIEDGTTIVRRADIANVAENAQTAQTAAALSGVLPQANGGTGGTALKTINGESIVGSGDIVISGGGGITESDIIQNTQSQNVLFTTTGYANRVVYLPNPPTTDKYLALLKCYIYSSDLPESNTITANLHGVNLNNWQVQRGPISAGNYATTNIIFSTMAIINQSNRMITVSLSNQPSVQCSAWITMSYIYIHISE